MTELERVPSPHRLAYCTYNQRRGASQSPANPSVSCPRRRSSTGSTVRVFCWLLQESLPANLCVEAPQTFPYAHKLPELTRLSCGPISKHASPEPILAGGKRLLKRIDCTNCDGSPLLIDLNLIIKLKWTVAARHPLRVIRTILTTNS